MRSLLLMAAMLWLIGGCASSPQAKFYTLSAVPPRERVQTVRPIAVTVDRVTVPELNDRPQFVVKVDATEVRLDEYSRWADSLKSQISSVIVADLAQSIDGALVSRYPQRVPDEQTYRVSVDVQNFESAPGEMASVTVVWSVEPPKPGPTVSGRTVVHEPVSAAGYDALVDAHSRALATVSSDIAGAIHGTLRP
jgi:uncharacterized lipoprotein YmbA